MLHHRRRQLSMHRQVGAVAAAVEVTASERRRQLAGGISVVCVELTWSVDLRLLYHRLRLLQVGGPVVSAGAPVPVVRIHMCTVVIVVTTSLRQNSWHSHRHNYTHFCSLALCELSPVEATYVIVAQRTPKSLQHLHLSHPLVTSHKTNLIWCTTNENFIIQILKRRQHH